jgi:hypothetical protein
MGLTSGESLDDLEASNPDKVWLRAYTAYIAGILINAVGFAGASELAPQSKCANPEILFSSGADSPSSSYSDIPIIVLYGLWSFCTRLLGVESSLPSNRCR